MKEIEGKIQERGTERESARERERERFSERKREKETNHNHLCLNFKLRGILEFKARRSHSLYFSLSLFDSISFFLSLSLSGRQLWND